MVLGGGGGVGGHLQGIQRLWASPGDGDLLIPGAVDLGSGQLLDSVGQELVTGKGGVEGDVNNPHQGGGGDAGVRIFL